MKRKESLSHCAELCCWFPHPAVSSHWIYVTSLGRGWGIAHSCTGCSPPLSESVAACLTLSAAELGKPVSPSVGLPPQCLGEAETWQSLGCEPGEPGSPRDGAVLLPGVCSTLPMHFHSPSGVSQRQMSAWHDVTGDKSLPSPATRIANL